MSQPVPARIFGFLAPDADQVVLLRRGPSALTQMLVWDLASDAIHGGQWLRARIELEYCDVSPNGKYFIGSFRDESRWRNNKSEYQWDRWTAISRPPYFTAVGLWEGGIFPGGGYWASSDVLVVRQDLLPVKGDPMFRPFRTREDDEGGRFFGFESERRGRLGWREVDREVFTISPWDSEVHRITWSKEWQLGQVRHAFGCLPDEVVLLDADGNEIKRVLAAPQMRLWYEVTPRGELIFAEDGCVWRWPEFPSGEPRLVADLNANLFNKIPPPDWAKRW